MNILTHVIYPTHELCLEEALYIRANELAHFSYNKNILSLNAGGVVRFDTYFNSFSIGKWRKYTDIEQFYLVVEAKGCLQVRLIHLDEQHRFHTLIVSEIEDEKREIEIPKQTIGGILFFELKAIKESELINAYWATNQKPKNSVKLGLSITTFNRQDAVKASTRRILEFLHDTDIDAHLVVVDNGKNVELPKDKKLTFIPNENLGGSGGFARGLYYLKEEQSDFTHCLFMDDDASCETESIYRTYRLLQYANEQNLAISGAMLLHDRPSVLWENGAKFSHHAIPLKHQRDMFNVHDILSNEDDEDIDYGGWWFFSFPIDKTSYPFPFFVRGDDINFGIVNNLKIITLNGVAVYGDDFSYKESPLTLYLDMRSHFLQHLLLTKLKSNYFTFLKLLLKPIARTSLTLKYASSAAQIEAVKNVLEGPSFFEKNIYMKKVFSIILPLNQEERFSKIDINNFDSYEIGPKLNYTKAAKFFRIATLNGHLIPTFFFKTKNTILYKIDKRFAAYFRREKILIATPEKTEGFILKHDKKRFFKIWIEALSLSLQMLKKHKQLKRAYQNKYRYLTSKEYWEKQFFKQKEDQD